MLVAGSGGSSLIPVAYQQPEDGVRPPHSTRHGPAVVRVTRWSDWSPDGHPTQWEFAFSLLAGVAALVSLWNATSVRWPWVVAGVLAFGIAVGPAGSTVVADRVGAWFRGIGLAGRLLVIVTAAVVAWTLPRVVPWVTAPLFAFATGGLVGVAVVVCIEYLR